MPLSPFYIPLSLLISIHICHQSSRMGSSVSSASLPIATTFQFPALPPTMPPGNGFANGTIDLGGLQVRQVTTFTRVWAALQGGPGGNGATFFEPSPIPNGYSMLGHYAQPNNRALFGWVLVAKEASPAALKPPLDYTLVWSSPKSLKQANGQGYIWHPTPPQGYKALGFIATATPDKPSLDKVRCVRSDLTALWETDEYIWGTDTQASNAGTSFNVFSLRPESRGVQAQSVSAGTFVGMSGTNSTSSLPTLACLKTSYMFNTSQFLSSMPNLNQIQSLFKALSPIIYFHPKEQFVSSSVSWYFTNGAQLYTKGSESNPVAVEPNGENLPQGGSNDGAYWLDLPQDSKERVKKGSLESSEAYLHVKPMLGGTFTDIAVWVFCPFNGAARAKVGLIKEISLGKIGEHEGDWEHVTLRISNIDGVLRGVFFSEHSTGRWVNAAELELQSGSNKPVVYASLHGHALYPKPGLVLQGVGEIGIRNDAEKSEMVMDTGARFVVVDAGYLGSTAAPPSPPWLAYAREWGPKIKNEEIQKEIERVKRLLPPGKLRSDFEKFVKKLPAELLGEEGPTGPKMKKNWDGDETQ